MSRHVLSGWTESKRCARGSAEPFHHRDAFSASGRPRASPVKEAAEKIFDAATPPKVDSPGGSNYSFWGASQAFHHPMSSLKRRESLGNSEKAVAYIRLSPSGASGGDSDRLGVDAQRRDVASWSVREGIEIVGTHQDIDVSGDVPPEGRPGLLDALAALREHNAGVLVVARRDRLARDSELSALIRYMVRKQGAIFRTADGVSDDDSPAGKMMQGMLDLFAEYEKALIVLRTRAAMAAKRRRGEMIGKPPYGHRLGEDGKTLVLDQAEQEVIRRAVEMRRAGTSLRAISIALNGEGRRSRSGNTFDHKQVINMLKRADEPRSSS
jgi:site-specific DNA recombinase